MEPQTVSPVRESRGFPRKGTTYRSPRIKPSLLLPLERHSHDNNNAAVEPWWWWSVEERVGERFPEGQPSMLGGCTPQISSRQLIAAERLATVHTPLGFFSTLVFFPQIFSLSLSLCNVGVWVGFVASSNGLGLLARPCLGFHPISGPRSVSSKLCILTSAVTSVFRALSAGLRLNRQLLVDGTSKPGRLSMSRLNLDPQLP